VKRKVFNGGGNDGLMVKENRVMIFRKKQSNNAAIKPSFNHLTPHK
jgi:hypothetical protein